MVSLSQQLKVCCDYARSELDDIGRCSTVSVDVAQCVHPTSPAAQVCIVTSVSTQSVIAGTAIKHVVARAAVERIDSIASAQIVVALCAVQDVVAVTSKECVVATATAKLVCIRGSEQNIRCPFAIVVSGNTPDLRCCVVYRYGVGRIIYPCRHTLCQRCTGKLQQAVCIGAQFYQVDQGVFRIGCLQGIELRSQCGEVQTYARLRYVQRYRIKIRLQTSLQHQSFVHGLLQFPIAFLQQVILFLIQLYGNRRYVARHHCAAALTAPGIEAQKRQPGCPLDVVCAEFQKTLSVKALKHSDNPDQFFLLCLHGCCRCAFFLSCSGVQFAGTGEIDIALTWHQR